MHVSSLLLSSNSSLVLVFSLFVEALGFLGASWSSRVTVYPLVIGY
jgi:hypothetical protein